LWYLRIVNNFVPSNSILTIQSIAMKNSVLFLLAAVVLLTSCNRVFYYKPAAEQPDNTRLTYNHGLPNLTGNTGECEITAEMVTRNSSGFLDLGLFIRNETDSLITFFPDQVKAYGFTASGNRKELKVYTAKEYIRYRNTRDAIIVGSIAALAIAGTVAAANATPPSEGLNNTTNFIAPWPMFWGPVPPFASHDGLIREHTMYKNEGMAGNIKIRKDDVFNHKYLLEVPVNGRYVKFVFDERMRRF
jgi:hypothetical protein